MKSWPIYPLGSKVRFLSGGTPSKDEPRYWGGEIPWVSSAEMVQRRIRDTELRVTEDGARDGSKLVPAKTVLVVVRGMSLAKEFRVAIAERELTFNQDLKALLPCRELGPTFLFYYLRSQNTAIRDSASEAAHGTKKLDMPVLEQWPLPLPPWATQKKIAAILSAYDDLIGNNRRRIALLEKMAEEIYREWFVRLRFPGHEQAKFEKGVPVGWEIKKVGELFTTSSGGTPPRENSTNYGGDICWAKTGELKSAFVLDTEEKITQQGLDNSSAKVYPKHTVVIAMYCAMPDISILGTDAATNQACCAFFPKKSSFHYTFSYWLIKFAQKHMIAFAHGAAQQNLSQELIKGFSLLVPKDDLITAFGHVAAPLYEQIEVLMRAINELTQSRDKLLPRLISGKLPVDALNISFPPSMEEPDGAAAEEALS